MNIILNSKAKNQKRYASQALSKPSAPGTHQSGIWIDGTKILPELIYDLISDGHNVRFRVYGESMYPTICDGDIITVAPLGASAITNGDIILYRHRTGVKAHRVMRIITPSDQHFRSAPMDSQDRSSSETLQFSLRGDAAIVIDIPVRADQILGKVIRVDRDGHRIDPYSFKVKICFRARRLAARLKRLMLLQ